jgi:hypothetical protein
MSSITRALAALPLVLSLAGCPAVLVQPLAQIPLVTDGTVDAARQGDRRIVVYPFEELRGAELGRASVSASIPLVSLLHAGYRIDYAEHSLPGGGDDPAVATGTLDQALPSLLAAQMRRMRLTPNAAATVELGPRADPRADYVVTGKLRRARYEQQESDLLGALLGLLGVPHLFARYELEYEIALYRGGDRATPLLRKSYRFTDSRVGGLYYHQAPRRALFVRGLQQTLPRVVEDIALALR